MVYSCLKNTADLDYRGKNRVEREEREGGERENMADLDYRGKNRVEREEREEREREYGGSGLSR